MSHNPLFFSLWKTKIKNIFGFSVVLPRKMSLFYMEWPSKHSCNCKVTMIIYSLPLYSQTKDGNIYEQKFYLSDIFGIIYLSFFL